MSSVNKVILIGNLGKDPDMRFTNQQFAVCSFSVATNERRKDQSGNWGDHTEWHNIVTFGKVAENCSTYLKKGSKVYVEGRLQTRKWQDKEGRDRYTTEIIAFTVQFLSSRAGAQVETVVTEEREQASGAPAGASLVESLPTADAIAKGGAGEPSFDDDDIPF